MCLKKQEKTLTLCYRSLYKLGNHLEKSADDALCSVLRNPPHECERPVSMTTNGSAAVAVEAATAERILHKLRDKGRREERSAPEMERRDSGGGRLPLVAWDLLAGGKS